MIIRFHGRVRIEFCDTFHPEKIKLISSFRKTYNEKRKYSPFCASFVFSDGTIFNVLFREIYFGEFAIHLKFSMKKNQGSTFRENFNGEKKTAF